MPQHSIRYKETLSKLRNGLEDRVIQLSDQWRTPLSVKNNRLGLKTFGERASSDEWLGIRTP